MVADFILMAHLWPLRSKVIHKGQEIFAIFCNKMAIYAYTWLYCLLLLQWVSRGFVVKIFNLFYRELE